MNHYVVDGKTLVERVRIQTGPHTHSYFLPDRLRGGLDDETLTLPLTLTLKLTLTLTLTQEGLTITG